MSGRGYDGRMHPPIGRPLGAASFLSLTIALPVAAHAQAQAQPEEMIVTGTLVPVPKREIGTAVSVIDSQQIELRGYDGLADLLRTQPGIGVTNTGGQGKQTVLRIRGEEGYRTQLIIDGVKAVDPSGPQVGPDFDSLLATDDLERVEILRGPQGFLYGADAGGVVNVMTHRGTGPLGGRLSLEGGSFGTRRVNASIAGGGDQGDYYLSVNDFATDGFNSQAADTVLHDRDGADNTTWHTRLGWNLSNDWRLQLVARNVDAKDQYDGCFHPITFATVYDCVATTDQTTYKVSAEHGGKKITHSFGYSDINVRHDNLSQGLSTFATHGELGRFEYTGSYRPANSQTLVYGVDLQDERVTSGEHRQRNQNGYYFEYEGEFGKDVFFTAGARYDDNDDFGSHTSGRVSVAVVRDLQGGNAMKYRASYGTGFRAPSLYEIEYNRGPSSFPPAAGLVLAPEESKGYDLGADFDARNGLHFEATLFNQHLTDEVFFDLATFSGYLQSQGRSESKGLELGLTVPIGKRLEFLANLTTNDTTDTKNQQRLRRPKRYGNFGIQYASSDRLHFLVNARFARDAIDIDTLTFGPAPLPDYTVLDASVSYSFSKTFDVYGRIENLANERYVEVVGFNTAGRVGYAGVRMRF
jgi:vitamin B12 transporter